MATRTVWTVDDYSVRFVRRDRIVEAYNPSTGCRAETYDNEADARADFERRVENLRYSWQLEHECSNGRFNGGWCATIERIVETDEYSDEWEFDHVEDGDERIWDGERFVERCTPASEWDR